MQERVRSRLLRRRADCHREYGNRERVRDAGQQEREEPEDSRDGHLPDGQVRDALPFQDWITVLSRAGGGALHWHAQ